MQQKNIRTFYTVLANSLVSTVTNSFLWFAVTFWAYLETESVIATSIIGGSYMLIAAALGLFFGTFVDHHKKKTVMKVSSVVTLVAFIAATLLYVVTPKAELLTLGGVYFWGFVLLILAGAIAGNMRMIALSTTVTLLVPEKNRDRANGMVGTVNGLAFAMTSVFSGIVIGQLGMGWALVIAVVLTFIVLTHLLTVRIPENDIVQTDDGLHKKIDIKGTMAAIAVVPGLLALIFFTTFNNFLGGVYMSLMDPYGLELVSVETWGIIWGFLSLGLIFGGMAVAKWGLGSSPLRSLFIGNIITWIACVFFTVKSSIILTSAGLFIYMCLIPLIESAEQTIIQKVVPYSRQGRVFGFAQSVENAASPITAFLIGPLAQLFFIPFMTVGGGAQAIGSWFGTGPDRGMALIFTIAGLIGLVVTLMAFASRSYKVLSAEYATAKAS